MGNNKKISELLKVTSTNPTDELVMRRGAGNVSIQAQNLTSDTGSLVVTSSITGTTITFTKGDGSTYTNEIESASYAALALTASYAFSSSVEITKEVSSSFADTASHAITASYALTSAPAASTEGSLTNDATIDDFVFNGATDVTMSISTYSASAATALTDISASLTTTDQIISSSVATLSGSASDARNTLGGDLDAVSASFSTSQTALSSSASTAREAISSSISTDLTALSSSVSTDITALSSSASDARNTLGGDLDAVSASFSVSQTALSASVSTDITALSSSASTARDVAASQVSGSLTALSASLTTTDQTISSSVAALSSSASTARDVLASQVTGSFTDLSASFSTSQTALSSSASDSRDLLSGELDTVSSSASTAREDYFNAVSVSPTTNTITLTKGDGTTVVENLVSSSYAVTASYAVSSSVEITKEVSSSYAETASHAIFAEDAFRSQKLNIGSYQSNPSFKPVGIVSTPGSDGVITTDAQIEWKGQPNVLKVNGEILAYSINVTGSVSASAFTGSILSTNGVISGSTQVDITSTTGYTAFSSSLQTTDNTISSSVATLSGSASDARNLLSGNLDTISSSASTAREDYFNAVSVSPTTNTITLTKGDGTTSVETLVSSSYAVTASYAVSSSVEITKEVSSSYADTASFSVTASYAHTASYVATASYAVTSTTAINANDLIIGVKNTSGETLSKGTPVYSTGVTGDNLNISAASASSAATMPAIGILSSTLSNNASGQVILTGKITGVDTSGFTAGNNIYVAPTGGFTETKPGGDSTQIQNIAIVGKVNATEGELVVVGSGRSNDVPNLPTDYIFLGDGNTLEVPLADAITGSLPSGTVSGSVQVDIASTTGYATFSSSLETTDQAISSSVATLSGSASTARDVLASQVSGSFTSVSSSASTAREDYFNAVSVSPTTNTITLTKGDGTTSVENLVSSSYAVTASYAKDATNAYLSSRVAVEPQQTLDAYRSLVIAGSTGNNGNLIFDSSLRWQALEDTLSITGSVEADQITGSLLSTNGVISGSSQLDNTEIGGLRLNAPVFGTGSDSPQFAEIRYENSNAVSYNQMYLGNLTGGKFSPGEYQKIVTILPDGASQNYQVVGRMTAQSGGLTQIIYFNAALRSDTTTDLVWDVTYNEEYNNTRFITPQIWTKETAQAGWIFAFECVTNIYGNVTVDFSIIPRNANLLSNITVNTNQTSEQTTIDTGYTSEDFVKTYEIDGTTATFTSLNAAGVTAESASYATTASYAHSTTVLSGSASTARDVLASQVTGSFTAVSASLTATDQSLETLKADLTYVDSQDNALNNLITNANNNTVIFVNSLSGSASTARDVLASQVSGSSDAAIATVNSNLNALSAALSSQLTAKASISYVDGEVSTLETADTTNSASLTVTDQAISSSVATLSGSASTARNAIVSDYSPKISGSFAQYISRIDQTGIADTVHFVTHNTNTIEQNISIAANDYEMTVANAGKYELKSTTQWQRATGVQDNVSLWIQVNGTNVGFSTNSLNLTDNFVMPLYAQWILDLDAGDVVRIAWSSTEGSASIVKQSAFSNPTRPSTPSANTQLIKIGD